MQTSHCSYLQESESIAYSWCKNDQDHYLYNYAFKTKNFVIFPICQNILRILRYIKILYFRAEFAKMIGHQLFVAELSHFLMWSFNVKISRRQSHRTLISYEVISYLFVCFVVGVAGIGSLPGICFHPLVQFHSIPASTLPGLFLPCFPLPLPALPLPGLPGIPGCASASCPCLPALSAQPRPASSSLQSRP